MNLMETLMMESKATEMTSKEDEEEQIQLESGWQWAPRSWVTKGDVKEMHGLVDKGCLSSSRVRRRERRLSAQKSCEHSKATV